MRLYLIQHGKALTPDKDPKKSLSQEGKNETEKIAQFLKSKNIKVDCIWHSKKERSKQTAQIIFETLSSAELVERDDLNPLDPVNKFPDEIIKLSKDLVIVGHLPFLQKLASLLLAGSEDLNLIAFKYSAVAGLDYDGSWKISYFIIPELI